MDQRVMQESKDGPNRGLTVPEFTSGVGAGGIRRDSFVGTTNGAGDIDHLFATPFATGVVPIVLPVLGDDFGTTVRPLASSVNNLGFRSRVRDAAGAAYVGAVRINYVAVAP